MKRVGPVHTEATKQYWYTLHVRVHTLGIGIARVLVQAIRHWSGVVVNAFVCAGPTLVGGDTRSRACASIQSTD